MTIGVPLVVECLFCYLSVVTFTLLYFLTASLSEVKKREQELISSICNEIEVIGDESNGKGIYEVEKTQVS